MEKSVQTRNTVKYLKEQSTQTGEKMFNLKVKKLDRIKSNIRNELIGVFLSTIESEYWLQKCFSIAFIFLANTFAAYFIISTILEYYKYEVTTSTRTLFETPAPFPKVIICSYNPFQTEYAVNFLEKINEQFSPNVSIFNSNQIQNMSFQKLNELIAKIYNIGIARMNTDLTDEEKKKLGHPFEDILVRCRFNLQDCEPNDFTWTFDYTYGNCYVFNSELVKKESYLSDIDYGLRLEFYTGFNERLNILNSITSGSGLIIRIENGTYLENNLDGIKSSSGFQTDINMERKFEFYLRKPYSDCVLPNDDKRNFESDLYDLIYHSNYQYHHHLCKIQCIQKLLIHDCNCTDANLLSLFNGMSICKTDAQINCSQNALENQFFTKDYFRDECSSLCPLECNTTEINYSLSSFQIIGDSYINYIIERPNLKSDFVTKQIVADIAKNYFVLLNIFYDDLSYTESTELPKIDSTALFGAIGGHMGLFLGVSLVSLGELILSCIDLYFLWKNEKNAHCIAEQECIVKI